MNRTNGFPKELLDASVLERVAYFQNYQMPHRRLQTVAEQLLQAIKQPAGASLIFLLGPSGVGKSTLLRKIRNMLIEEALAEMEADKGYIPVAGVEAIAPDSGNFDWKDFYIRSLQTLGEPLIDKKISRTDTKLKLRFALESALKHRRLDAFFIDEAQNFGKVASGRKMLDQTDCIKSLANVVQTQFVLCGTYELIDLRNLSAQLCRRSLDIHFSRYKFNGQDSKSFRSVLRTFQSYLPVREAPDLTSHWEYCYERSIGCIGILKDWLTKTLNGVLEQQSDASTLTIHDLERYAWSPQQCLIMAKETREQEKSLEDSDETLNELRQSLGMDSVTSTSKEKSITSRNSKQHRKGPKVGQPSPERRLIGVDHHEKT
jgi:energy-coupling factor transporter ATP-binding protein EcfA2